MNKSTLYNGVKIPLLGLGANAIYGDRADIIVKKKCEDQYSIYAYALENEKCQLFDTSGAYGFNEEILGNAIAASGVDRKKIFLISKISNRQQDKLDVRSAFENSLKNLKTDYLDIYLIHWPQPDTYIEIYKQIEKLYDEKLVRAIGVCNFNIHHLEYLSTKANVAPMVNQIEIHPLFTQDNIVNYCKAFDILPIAYSPVGRMHDCLVKAKPIYELSRKYKRSPVEIILRWHYQLGRVSIPRTCNRDHLDEIISIDNFELTEREVYWISSINNNVRLRYDPDCVDFTRT